MTAKKSHITYDRISADPQNFEKVFDRQISLADAVRSGKVEVDQGAVEAKALYGATKSLEGDLHARIFAERSERGAKQQIGNGNE